MKLTENIKVLMTKEMRTELEEYAEKTYTQLSTVIRQALSDFLRSKKNEK